MYKNELLTSIDKVSESIIDSEISVCESMLTAYNKGRVILEEYQGNDVSSFKIFSEGYVMEAEVKNQKDDNIIVRAAKKMRDAIAKLVAIIFKKLGCDGFNPDKVGAKPSTIKENTEKAKKFERKHPAATACLITVLGTGAIYGGGKLVLVGEKAAAMNGFDDQDKEKIKETFNNQTGELKIPFDIKLACEICEKIDEKYDSHLKELLKLYTGDTLNEERVVEFMNNGFDSMYHNIVDLYDDEFMRMEALSVDSTPYKCRNVQEWNSLCEEFDSRYKRMTVVTLNVDNVEKILWDVRSIAKKKFGDKFEKKFDKLTSVNHKILGLINTIATCETELESLAKVMNKYLDKYFRLENNVKEAGKKIGEIGSQVFSAAKEVHEINNQQKKHN